VVSVAQHSLRKPPAPQWPHPAHTQQEVQDGITHCRELLHILKTHTQEDVMARMDRWLEELCELKELQWVEDLEVIE
jgi:hypothetical protein